MNTKGTLIAAFSFLAFIWLLPAMVFHWKNRNIPACSLILWLIFSNLTGFINALIWSGENFSSAFDGVGYCDVLVRLNSGMSSGKLASIACLIFNLYMIIAAETPQFLMGGSKIRIITNLLMCWFTPILVMGLSYIVQANRYVVVRYRGCAMLVAPTWLSIVLINLWSLLWAIIALLFAVLVLYSYFKKRRDILDILRCTNSGLNLKRFARLLIFSLLIVLVLTPFVIHNLVSDIPLYKMPFRWSEVHNSDWGVKYAMEGSDSQLTPQITDICLSALTFLLFGLGSDAIGMYKSAFAKVGLLKPSQIEKAAFNEDRHSLRQTADSKGTAVVTLEELWKDQYSGHHLSLDSSLAQTFADGLENDFMEDMTGVRFDFQVNRDRQKGIDQESV